MLFNKIAAAILIVGISAMVIGKVSTILLPHGEAGSADTAGAGGPALPPPDPDPGWPAAMAEADAAAGKRQAGKCVSCHTLTKGGPHRVGPNLYGVVGRRFGGAPGFNYSSNMKNHKGVWTLELLYKYLPDPAAMVPGTKMTYRLTKWKQRRDIVAYLATLGDKPVPLPKVPKPKKTDAPKDGGATDGKKAPEKKTEKMPAKDDKKPAATPAKKDEPAKKDPAPAKDAKPTDGKKTDN